MDKRPRPRLHISVNGVRGRDVKYSSRLHISDEGPHGEVEDRLNNRFQGHKQCCNKSVKVLVLPNTVV